MARKAVAAPPRRLAGRRWWWLGLAAAALLVAVLLVWALWPTHTEQQPRARQYLAFTACLLTDSQGVAGAEAAPVWAGMQDASLATRAKVQYLSVSGPQTVENALPFLSSLAQGRCDLVFAVGAVPVGAVRQGASTFPNIRFVVVGGGAQGSNVSKVDGSSPAETQAAVKRVLVDAVHT
jgi:basic membrane lipoprotein Med (substrate-binding protein (PBP1-ABC) superfamily)